MKKINPYLVVCIVLILGTCVHANTYYVDAARPDDSAGGTNWITAKKTIQAAVDLSAEGDTVFVADGVYDTGTTITPGYSLSNRVVITKAVTVQSVNGPDVTAIKGSGTNFYNTTSACRCVFLTGGVLSGFTLQEGTSKESSSLFNGGGGGVCVQDSAQESLVTNCVIRDCRAYRGGGISGGIIRGCVVTNNAASGDGGGVYGGTLTDCRFIDNKAAGAGGGACGATLNGCLLTANFASNGGGAYSGALTNCTLTANTASYGGGSYYSNLSNCLVVRNKASWSGGGADSGTLTCCTLMANTAADGGGSYETILNNCLVARNQASGSGGGVYYGAAVNCTIVGNSADYESGVYSYSSALTNCIIWANQNTDGDVDNYSSYCELAYCCTTPLPAGTGNICSDPVFVGAEDDDYRLAPGSPCLDAGNNLSVSTEYDLAGNARIQNGTIDIGAFEGATSVTLAAPTTVVATDRTLGDKVHITWDAVAEATCYRVYRAVKRDGVKECLGDHLTEQSFDDFTAIPERTYWYWVKAVNESTGEKSFLSEADIGAKAFAPVWFVDVSRDDDSGDGMSWGTAKKTIQAAVDVAAAGDAVIVTDGIYHAGGSLSNRVTLLKPVMVKSLNGAARTVIEGSGIATYETTSAVRCVYMSTGSLEGFTLQNGVTRDGEDGGGAYLENSINSELRDCVITNCMSANGGGVRGGTLVRSRLVGNTADYDGGGAYKSSLKACVLIGNTSMYGGGVSDCDLVNCVLAENTASGYVSYYNCYPCGGGASESRLVNCTVVSNAAPYGSCGGAGGCALTNCIVWGNTASVADNYGMGTFGTSYYGYEVSSSLDFCCTIPLPTMGFGNLAVDPIFVNSAKNDYRLAMLSPCIDAGTNSCGDDENLEEGARVLGRAIDIGAYEMLEHTQALNNSNLVWTSGGDAYWFGQTNICVDGTGAMQSGPIDDNQQVWIQASTEGKGTLAFSWRVSSESQRDYLRFYVDDQASAALSGDSGWQTFSTAVTNVGAHTFRWTYVKGKSGASGEDAGWLDQVTWTAVTAVVSVAASPSEGGKVGGAGVYTRGQSITLRAIPNDGWRFAEWENGDTVAQRAFIVPDTNATYTAFFERDAIALADALDSTLVWTTCGDADWNGWVLENAHDGDDAAQSGAITNSSATSLKTTVTGPGTLSFWWRVSCEEDYDYLDFSVDGLTRTWLTGESGWQQESVSIDSGTHDLEWCYWKDESNAEGEDAAWVDQVVWTWDTSSLTGFPLWAANNGLTGNCAVIFGEDLNRDGIANGFEYAFGTNLTDHTSLLHIRMIDGSPVLETPKQDNSTTGDVAVTVLGTTNLVMDSWKLALTSVTNKTEKPANCEWYVPSGITPSNAYFRLKATLK